MKNIEEMTLEELNNLIDTAQKAKNNLLNREKEKDWLLVRRAINNYIDKWGCIDIVRNADNEVLAFLGEDNLITSEIGVIQTTNCYD
jgi:sugar-specific transcriptional regulator TrmB